MRIVLPERPALARRLWTPRLVATLALFVVSAAFFCAVVGQALVRQADERQAMERRAALLTAIQDIRNAGADFTRLEPRQFKYIERTAGLKKLRFETELVEDDREVQSVLDPHGRILGWFSWEPENAMSSALGELQPLAILTAILLVCFAGFALWQVRRTVRELGASEQLAWQLAHEDMLTGLPNHRKMIEQIDAVMVQRAHGEVATLAFLDLDGLKDINDGYGHAAGDDVLKEVAKRLKNVMPRDAVCGRFDGDEFALALIAPDMEAAEDAIQAVAAELARPYWANGQIVQVGVTTGLAHSRPEDGVASLAHSRPKDGVASLAHSRPKDGVALLAYAPRDSRSRDELMRRADLALRSGKRRDRGKVVCFSPPMDVEFDDRRLLERDLKRAIDDQSLDVHYQPIVAADGMRILGAEALLRWTHPVRGAIPPGKFVPIAEQSGLMPRLGEFVLRRALADAKRWPGIYIAVNLSPVQVRDPALVETITAMLAEHGVPASRLMLEVTEGVLIDNPAEAKARLDALKALGVRLALDDFGTGYSSLTYLQRFRFDKLKIDRGFVDPLARDAQSQAVVQAIVALGRALNLTLLAEGVETEEQRVLLRLAGCDEMQGYLFARPAPRETLDRLVAGTAEVPAAARAAVA